MTRADRAAIGLAPHSGWAAAVAIGGSSDAPEVLVRTRIEMADPRLPGSKQPYHELERHSLGEAERRLPGYQTTAATMASDALRAIVADLEGRGYRTAACGILDASERTEDPLASILRSHARIHRADGDHFRAALAQAAAGCDLSVSRVRSRDLVDHAGRILRRSAPELQDVVRQIGRRVGAPWGADQKAAALLAWSLWATERKDP